MLNLEYLEDRGVLEAQNTLSLPESAAIKWPSFLGRPDVYIHEPLKSLIAGETDGPIETTEIRWHSFKQGQVFTDEKIWENLPKGFELSARAFFWAIVWCPLKKEWTYLAYLRFGRQVYAVSAVWVAGPCRWEFAGWPAGKGGISDLRGEQCLLSN